MDNESQTFDKEGVISKGVEKLVAYLNSCFDGEGTVRKFVPYDDLKEQFDTSLSGQGVTPEKILELMDQILELSVKSHHRHFHNQLFSGVDRYAQLGDFMATAINGTMYTYEMGPLFTLMEKEVIELVGTWLKWDTIDGIGTPGGSFSNLKGLLCARHRKFPEGKTKGYFDYP